MMQSAKKYGLASAMQFYFKILTLESICVEEGNQGRHGIFGSLILEVV